MFEFIEEPFDEVALAIEGEVALAGRDAVGFGWDDWSDAPLIEGLDQGVGVIGLVSEERLRIDLIEEQRGLAEVGHLPLYEGKGDGVAKGINDDMDFGGQSAPGSADGLLAVFFRAPALCW